MDQLHKIQTALFPILSYRKMGQGPVLVLIHGFPSDSSLWANVCPSLAEKFTVIMPDLPGVGGSTYAGELLTIEQMAESVKLILDAEKIDKAVMAGHSMGGYTAIAFAELYPQMLKGLSFIHSVASGDNEEKKETRRKSIKLLEKEGGKEAFVKEMIPKLFAKRFKEEHPEVLQQQVDNGMKVSAAAMISFYNTMIMRPDRTEVLKQVNFPAQFIVGKEDNVVPVAASLQQSTLAGVNFVSVYPETAHMAMLENPDGLIKDLADFTGYCYK
jgi:Predicted hydrolases or acyltransferases (alpha/beta hydrolase superfamily)